ncbi:Octanoyltransferase [Frankliniella fusca]|uniref:Octanoyltransferase n=1 Tax=Frankliniella fusca TaxID=407009 RepID=A0AAE1GVW6_9NEOP|nr:Octanoyltransferase [Frankliniella fusca]
MQGARRLHTSISSVLNRSCSIRRKAALQSRRPAYLSSRSALPRHHSSHSLRPVYFDALLPVLVLYLAPVLVLLSCTLVPVLVLYFSSSPRAVELVKPLCSSPRAVEPGKMPSVLTEILDEWDAACFHSDELLAEAYTTFLANLVEASVEERADPRVIPFLLCKRPREEDEKPEEVQPTLEVLQTRERHLKRFRATFREEVMLIRGLGDALPSEDLMVGMFDSAIQRQRDAVHAMDDDRVTLEIENSVSAENPIWFSMCRADQLNGRVILDKLSRVLNSNQSFMSDGQLKLSYIHIPVPRPGGRRINRVANESMEQWIERKNAQKCIFSPNNNDNMCLTRCVAVASARDRMSRYAFCRLKARDSVIQTKEAESLCDLAHIDKTNPCGLDEVRLLQDVLPDFRLCVFTDKEGNECVFKGPQGAARKNIYLLLHGRHFFAILYPEAAFDMRFLCRKCVVFYNNPGGHRCEGSCWRCLGPDNDTENRYERTKVLTALFKDKGYTVIEKWECVFNTELKTDPEMRAYFEAHPTTRTPPLILRDALVGGRTSALR